MLGWGLTVVVVMKTTAVVNNAVAVMVVSKGAAWWWYIPNGDNKSHPGMTWWLLSCTKHVWYSEHGMYC